MMNNRLTEIHNHRPPFYIYRITFLDPTSHLYGATYYGQRKLQIGESSLNWYGNKYYHGSSSIVKKQYWPYHELHIKEILEHCYSQEEANEKEKYWIKYGIIHDENCINCNEGGHYCCSELTRLHMRQNHADFTGEKNPAYGKSLKDRLGDNYESYCKKRSDIANNLVKEGRCRFSKGFKGEENPIYGKKRIVKDGVQKYVKPSELDDYLSNGWLIGSYKNIHNK